jgi:hypothetical protein
MGLENIACLLCTIEALKYSFEQMIVACSETHYLGSLWVHDVCLKKWYCLLGPRANIFFLEYAR